MSRVATEASTRPPYLSIPTREIVTPPAARIVSNAARGLRLGVLVGATGVQLRRVDAAQSHLGVDTETGPRLHAGLKRVAVDDAHHLGRIDRLQIELA